MNTLIAALQAAASSDVGVHFVGRGADEEIPYRSLALRAARTAGALHALGVRAGETVALVLPTCPAFYDAFFGAVWLGAIPVPLYPPQRLGKLDEFHARTAAMLHAVRARIVVTDKRVRRLLGQAVQSARPPLGCVCVEDLCGDSVDAAEVDRDAIALIQFSSGTTVDPKPVALTHAQLLANMGAISDRLLGDLGVHAHPRPLTAVSWLPLYHDMGLIGCMLTAVYESTKLVLIPPELFVARPALWLQTMSTHRGNISAAPNFAYNYCAERVQDEELRSVDLSAWEVALNGAEPVTALAMERFTSRFAPFGFRREAFTPVYGLAEASLAVTFSPPCEVHRTLQFDSESLAENRVALPSDRGTVLVSVGKPLAGTTLRIVNDANEETPERHCGRVQVRGPGVMRGYFGRPEATQQALRNGWLDTGDLGFLYAGELYLTGRAKDLIILRGRNYAPQDVEQHIDNVVGVRTGCAIAVSFIPETAPSEVLLLLVEKRAESNDDDDAIIAAIRSAVLEATGLLAHDIVLLAAGTLPRTSSGKLRRQAALQQYIDQALHKPRKPTALHLAHEMLRSHMALRRSGSP